MASIRPQSTAGRRPCSERAMAAPPRPIATMARCRRVTCPTVSDAPSSASSRSCRHTLLPTAARAALPALDKIQVLASDRIGCLHVDAPHRRSVLRGRQGVRGLAHQQRLDRRPRLDPDGQEGQRRHLDRLDHGRRRGALLRLDRRHRTPHRRRVVRAAVHPTTGEEPLVEDQPRAHRAAHRRGTDAPRRPGRGGTGESGRPLGYRLRTARPPQRFPTTSQPPWPRAASPTASPRWTPATASPS